MQEEEALKTLKEAPPTKTHYTYPGDLTIEPPVQ
jgi:hypothetical protein